MKKTGFDNKQYIRMQSRNIAKRVSRFNKLYLEFGGKLFDDNHASRVLPGFEPDSKIKMLLNLKDKVEIVLVINANHIDANKIRSDLGITYSQDLLRLIDSFTAVELAIGGVVITHFNEQPEAVKLRKKLEKSRIKVAYHYTIENYPNNIDNILSANGFGKNQYLPTSKEIIVVTAPGPGSGKMATCLSQIYHDNLHGLKSGYAKFETFPIWNLPLNHPVNLAYEAATVDLSDVNMIDPFHLEAYNEIAINYNRDVEVFPVLNAMFERIQGTSPYKSPTDMGVNMAGYCIIDDEACREASRQEIIRRYYNTACALKHGIGEQSALSKIELLMSKAGVTFEDRPVVAAALAVENKTGKPAAAIQLPDGQIVTGKTSSLLGPTAGMLLNALKALGGVNKELDLLSKAVIEPIQDLKVNYLGATNPRLHADEILQALSICAVTNPLAKLALEQLRKLRGCEAHASVILSSVDERTLRRLGINLTCEPRHESQNLYHS